jgi:hypothetical protein
MASKKPGKPVAVISAVIILLSVAALFLLQNFRDIPFSQSWPVLPMAVGLCLAVGSMVELGGAILGFFLLVILSTTGTYPLSKSWPFILIWIAVLVVVGYLRSKAAKKKKASSSS